jgi:hypothetical protein
MSLANNPYSLKGRALFLSRFLNGSFMQRAVVAGDLISSSRGSDVIDAMEVGYQG